MKNVNMQLTSLSVDPKTKATYEHWRNVSRRTHGAMFQQLIIFAAERGFDPNASRVVWPEEGGKNAD